MVEVEKTVDKWYGKVQKQVSGKISSFVAFIFFLVAAGAWLGITVIHYWPDQALIVILIPAVTGLIAYYNRAFATVVFVLLLLAFLI